VILDADTSLQAISQLKYALEKTREFLITAGEQAVPNGPGIFV
jgi:hypothetical protein